MAQPAAVMNYLSVLMTGQRVNTRGQRSLFFCCKVHKCDAIFLFFANKLLIGDGSAKTQSVSLPSQSRCPLLFSSNSAEQYDAKN